MHGYDAASAKMLTNGILNFDVYAASTRTKKLTNTSEYHLAHNGSKVNNIALQERWQTLISSSTGDEAEMV